ncbi:MAG: Pectic acid lyase/Pectic acid lyase [Verrucomicrobia bacterium]|nr:MAG: Pectic acid lyase/Pectic acid lyase [Verrucomicrobiota bacterium]
MYERLRFVVALLVIGGAIAHCQEAAGPSAPAAKPVIDPYPSVAQVEAAMHKAVSFARTSLSFAGGYATRWSRDLKESRTSDTSGTAVISIEGPGTPVMGQQFLRGWEITRDPLYLQAAREVADALLWTQLASGGWETFHDYSLPAARKQHYRRDIEAGDTDRGQRRALSTLDDDKTQFALLFLIDFAALPENKTDTALQSALRFGLDSLLAAQAPNGGWSQGFSGPFDPAAPVQKPSLPADWPKVWPDLDYTGYYTLNDGNLLSVARVLIRAHEVSGEARYLAALRKLGDFLVLAQCPEPQAGWAQQYNLRMEPAWARKFEPPSISPLESLITLNTLVEIWLATGEERYRSPIPSALAWLETSRLPGGSYARFMELHTNKPLYFVKDTYELTYDDSNLPTHYGFKIDELQGNLDDFKEAYRLTREERLAKLKPPTTPKAWLSKAKGTARKVVIALEGQNKEGFWTDDNVYEAHLFVKHFTAMANYTEAAKAAGPLFETLRAAK